MAMATLTAYFDPTRPGQGLLSSTGKPLFSDSLRFVALQSNAIELRPLSGQTLPAGEYMLRLKRGWGANDPLLGIASTMMANNSLTFSISLATAEMATAINGQAYILAQLSLEGPTATLAIFQPTILNRGFTGDEQFPSLALLNNYTADRAPLATDNASEGYSIGSEWWWIDNGTLKKFVLQSFINGNANWNQYVPATGTGLEPRGDWLTATEYAAGDWVRHGGASYVATAAHESSAENEPGTGEDWEDFWTLLAQDGAQGPPGTNGTNGTNGAPGPAGPPGTPPVVLSVYAPATLVNGIRVPVVAAQLTAARFAGLDSGTATATIRKNGVAIAALENVALTTSAQTVTVDPPVAFALWDEIQMIVTAASAITDVTATLSMEPIP